MPRRTKQHITGEMAVDLLRSALPSEWILRRQPEADYGVDAELEIVEGQEVSGALLKAQVRGTISNRPWKVPIKLEWLRYWSEMTVPVVVFRVYLPTAEIRWLDISAYVADNDLDWWTGAGNKQKILDLTEAIPLPHSINDLEEIALEARGLAVTASKEWKDEIRATPIVFRLLIEVFHGDFDEWLQWLRREASDAQIAADFSTVFEWKQRCEEDPMLMDTIRAAWRSWVDGDWMS
jgi:Domain of unknown function (DUF4365)